MDLIDNYYSLKDYISKNILNDDVVNTIQKIGQPHIISTLKDYFAM